MRLGIMQPYFFPYIGYFSLIRHTDRYILLDQVQFIRHGWIERNRILKQSGGWGYIAVPLKKHARETLISDISIDNSKPWKEKIISQLGYYKGAPNYYKVIKLMKEILGPDFESIVRLDCAALKAVCDYLAIHTPIEIFSDMALDIGCPDSADEWALRICQRLGADEYWNPPGGMAFFDCRKYEENHVNIYFQKVNLSEYRQKQKGFEPGLSVLDALMFLTVDEINEMLDDYELVSEGGN